MTPAEKKKDIQDRLQKAVELEWATIPPYLMADFSLQPGTNGEAAGIIRSVYVEEMLHLALVGNVLTATGGGAVLGPGNLPAYPLTLTFRGRAFTDRSFDIHLAAFSEETIGTFLKIEQPTAPPPVAAAFDHLTVEGFTIGEFYRGIIGDLKALCDEMGEKNVFSGDPARQVPDSNYWGAGGKLIQVGDLATARRAMELIIDQGEGTGGARADGKRAYFDNPEEVAHYYRFNEILCQRRYARTDEPGGPPTGPRLTVNYEAVYPIKPDCKAAEYAGDPQLSALNEDFNRLYSQMLIELTQAFNGSPHSLYSSVLHEMHALPKKARAILQRTVPGDAGSRCAMPTFEWVEPLLPSTSVTISYSG